MFNFYKNKFSEKIQSLLDWVAVNSHTGDIIVLFSNEKNYFAISNNQKITPRLVPSHKIREFLTEASFVIIDKSNFTEAYSQGFSIIYQSADFSFLENSKRHKSLLPIRFGLTKDEKKELLAIARRELVSFLKPVISNNESDSEFFVSQRLHLISGAGVALWVEGTIRGSMIIDSGITLRDSVIKATKLAARDLRFKPINYDDLDKVQIEITIIEEPKIEAPESIVDYNKGYLAVSEHGRGWYIPEVFNCRNFWNYTDFKNSLLSDKAQISLHSKYKIFNFAVEDFIEYKSDVLTFAGPIINKNNLKTEDIKIIYGRAELAAKWICALQEKDGNLPAVYDVLSGNSRQSVDWPRLAFSTWALAEFGNITQDEKCLKVAKNAYSYFEKYFLLENPINIDHSRLGIAYAYIGNYLVATGNIDDAEILEKKIELLNETSMHTISAINILSFRVRLSMKARINHESLLNTFFILVAKFRNEKKNLNTEIAVYPELAAIAMEFYTYYEDTKYQDIANEIFLWLKLHQRSDGAFSARVEGGYPYTRGTTKVFEVLSLNQEANKEAIFLALEWIWSMQFDETNSFYIKKHLVPNVIGSFRSGVGNTDIWIDSAAHFLIGVSRLLRNRSSFK